MIHPPHSPRHFALALMRAIFAVLVAETEVKRAAPLAPRTVGIKFAQSALALGRIRGRRENYRDCFEHGGRAAEWFMLLAHGYFLDANIFILREVKWPVKASFRFVLTISKSLPIL